jgi:myo-inositol-1(or 4)-monophosphatase
VAAGYSDGFFETGLKAWDVAAGSLLVTEAGGLVGNYTGDADFMHQSECVAGNPRIYAQLVNVLAKYSKFAGVADKMQVAQAQPASNEQDPSAAAAPKAKTLLKAPKPAAGEAQQAAKPEDRPRTAVRKPRA